MKRRKIIGVDNMNYFPDDFRQTLREMMGELDEPFDPSLIRAIFYEEETF
jgi:hypothetical protein